MMVKVKICGITNPYDASKAVELGVDALGFVFTPSPRRVSPQMVRHIISALPAPVQKMGVFVDEDIATVRDIVAYCGLDLIQLHGAESPEFCRELMPRTVKSIRVKDESSLLTMRPYMGKVRALLLDTYQKGIKGGTGKVFDWSLAAKAGEFGVPIILSGGLKPSNVKKAISAVKPHAVDANSGVEICPGRKSLILMKELIETVKSMNNGGFTDD
jgi:phosphoribosylanthranilate isomerase